MTRYSRRQLAFGLASLPAGFSIATELAAADQAGASDGIPRSSESIHQEVQFDANRARV